MSIRREFLGWDAAFLPRCVAWLRERHGQGDRLDLSRVLVVLPGARAGRRLLELLSEQPCLLVPPKIITLGSLPEHLYSPAAVQLASAAASSPASAFSVADDLTCALARMHGLRRAPVDVLSRLVPKPPEDGDLLEWLALSREVSALHEALAGEGVSFSDVIANAGAMLQPVEQERWQALATMHDQYEQTLAAHGFIDRHQARAAAIAEERCRCEGHIVLAACADLNRVTRRMLAQVEERATALIFAPDSEAAAFDDFGCVNVDRWCERAIDVRDELIQVVDRPRDQAFAALCAITPPEQRAADQGAAKGRVKRGGAAATQRQFARSDDAPAAASLPALDEITVGLGDETLGPLMQRTFELAGLPAHLPVGKPIAQSRPALLLAGLADFASRLRMDDFAAVLRHPDLERHLRRVLAAAHRADESQPGAAIQSWLTLLDDYITEHLGGRTVGNWLGDAERAEHLKAVYDAVMALLPGELAIRRPLPAWSQPIAALLRTVYEPRPLDPREPADNELLRSLGVMGDSLRSQAKLDPADAITPLLTFADAVNLMLDLLRDQQTPPAVAPQGAAVELLGWLELPLDDAPNLVITGFNEHHIPQSSTSDAFIPDSLRRQLGLLDNRRRLARDAAALTAILHSRPGATMIAGRRGADDEPLKPSRLLLTLDGEALAQRVRKFYPDDPSREHVGPAPVLLPSGGVNRFTIPLPRPRPVNRLSVTAFAAYIHCPFRFYLKHVLRLTQADDCAVELDALRFGTLAHDVLADFGHSEYADATDAARIAAYLSGRLDLHARKMLGPEPTAAAMIQIEQLRERLTAFAPWQATHAAAGWRIDGSLIERELSWEFDRAGGKLLVKGRIDRIDRRGDERFILDYKTGDQGKTPEQVHRAGHKDSREWVDLQLPLYRWLFRSLKEEGNIKLGYVLLPKKRDEAGLSEAEWSADELKLADVRINEVIDAIRAGRFWPPREPLNSRDVDEYSSLCMDAYQGRPQVIRAIRDALERSQNGQVAP